MDGNGFGIYVAFDSVSGSVLCTMSSMTDGTCVRENLVALSRVVPNVLQDIRLYRVADLDRFDMEVTPVVPPRLVSWDSYKFPESVMEKVSNGSVQNGGKK